MRRLLTRFLRSDAGAVSVEAVLMFPLLLWAYGAMFVFWDAFKTQNLNVKATYTIADMISREPEPLDTAYIAGLNTIYGFLLDPFTGDMNNDIRVSVVTNTIDPGSGNEVLELDWSCATGSMVAHPTVDPLVNQVPVIAVNDQLIIVESQMDWTPPIDFGLPASQRRHLMFTSPRFVPQVLLNGSC